MGSQIFESIGISKEVVDKYFTDTVSRVGGVTLKDIENAVIALSGCFLKEMDGKRIV